MPVDALSQSVVERHRRAPVENLVRFGDVGPSRFNIGFVERLIIDRSLLPQQRFEFFNQCIQ